MRLLQIIEEYGLKPKRVASTKGGEYACACPRCGGDDRFRIQPENKGGLYFCRHKDSCKTSGDAIQFLRDFMGLSFKDAAARTGKQLSDKPYQKDYTPKNRDVPKMESEEKLIPEERWRREAAGVVGDAHEILLQNKERLAWLEKRGIGTEAVKRFKLGWIEKQKFYGHSRWGLSIELNENKREKRIWIPRGYLIPQWDLEKKLTMLQVRKDDIKAGEYRYHPVKGSTVTPMIIPPSPSIPEERIAWVVVESRLDAFLISYFIGDLVGVMAQGNNTANPCRQGIKLLDASPLILYSMDYDEAGLSPLKKWKSRFDALKFWPVPEGGDPGEYKKKYGGNIRDWILTALPPGLRIIKKNKVPMQTGQKIKLETENDLYKTIKTENNRKLFITEDFETFQRLEKEGKLVFSRDEVRRVTAAVNDAKDANVNITAETFINIKEILGGRITGRIELK